MTTFEPEWQKFLDESKSDFHRKLLDAMKPIAERFWNLAQMRPYARDEFHRTTDPDETRLDNMIETLKDLRVRGTAGQERPLNGTIAVGDAEFLIKPISVNEPRPEVYDVIQLVNGMAVVSLSLDDGKLVDVIILHLPPTDARRKAHQMAAADVLERYLRLGFLHREAAAKMAFIATDSKYEDEWRNLSMDALQSVLFDGNIPDEWRLRSIGEPGV